VVPSSQAAKARMYNKSNKSEMATRIKKVSLPSSEHEGD
jgi:ribosomal protein S20